MMIKANGEYLDFNGDIDIESRIKLFDQIDKSSGEFSYDISFDDNGHNRKILGIPRADTVKSIYQNVTSEIIDDIGQSIYLGKLQVNRIEGGQIISTFFAGNTDWFAQLSDPLSSLPLYRYDVDLNEGNIQASWLNDSGIVFPILDTGTLVTRSLANLKIEDFTSAFYIKTLFNEIFNPLGIKLEGDLINDSTFNKLVLASNGRNQDAIDDRSSFAKKITTQSLSGLSPAQRIFFTEQSVFPYFDGASDNMDSNGLYTADIKMAVDLSVTLELAELSPTCEDIFITVRINGVTVNSFTTNVCQTLIWSHVGSYILNAGDTLSVFAIPSALGASIDVTGGTFKVTPTFLYKVFGKASIPNWTKGEFVSNILRLFNALPSYNLASKTLTLDLFNKIKEKQYVDVSDELVVNTVDFSEFVSDYAKNNIFKYQESDSEDLRVYNISNFISYGSGNLTIENEYIQNTTTVIESDFTSPITYLNGIFDMSMERFNFVELDEIEDNEITSVSNSGGVPRFNITNADDIYSVGSLARLETTVTDYNGDWIVNAVTSSYITVNGLVYVSNATGSSKLMRHKITTDNNVYLFINIPNVVTNFFSSKTEFLLEDSTTFSTTAISYFNILSNGTAINRVYKQSLSFGAPNKPLNYQITMLDTYWPLFSRILDSPVMLMATGYFKRRTYDEIKSFLRPLMVKTEETVNLYYMNKLIGYKGSERGCEAQLIKLN